MVKGEAVRKIARAGKLLERLPTADNGEPLPPPIIGNDATSLELERATVAMREHQTMHKAWERETGVADLDAVFKPKDMALVKEILTDAELMKDEQLRRLTHGERMSDLSWLLIIFDATPNEDD
jgi:hypothetical protein